MIILSMKSNYKGGELVALATQSTFDPVDPPIQIITDPVDELIQIITNSMNSFSML